MTDNSQQLDIATEPARHRLRYSVAALVATLIAVGAVIGLRDSQGSGFAESQPDPVSTELLAKAREGDLESRARVLFTALFHGLPDYVLEFTGPPLPDVDREDMAWSSVTERRLLGSTEPFEIVSCDVADAIVVTCTIRAVDDHPIYPITAGTTFPMSATPGEGLGVVPVFEGLYTARGERPLRTAIEYDSARFSQLCGERVVIDETSANACGDFVREAFGLTG